VFPNCVDRNHTHCFGHWLMQQLINTTVQATIITVL